MGKNLFAVSSALALFTVPAPTTASVVTLPFYGKVHSKELCGETKGFCQPTASKLWTTVSDKLAYKGNPLVILGRSFNDIYSSRKKCFSDLKQIDIEESGANEFDAQIGEGSVDGLAIKVMGSLNEFLASAGVKLPDAIKLGVQAEVRDQIFKTSSSMMKLKFATYSISDEVKNEQLDDCLDATESDRFVATGISVVSISGEWQTTMVRQAFTSVGLQAEVQKLGIDDKGIYDLGKSKILTGTLKPASFIFAFSYEYGRKA